MKEILKKTYFGKHFFNVLLVLSAFFYIFGK